MKSDKISLFFVINRSTLANILQVSINELKKAFRDGFLNNPLGNEAIQLLFRCLSYNFSLSFFEIEIDSEPRDLTILSVMKN